MLMKPAPRNLGKHIKATTVQRVRGKDKDKDKDRETDLTEFLKTRNVKNKGKTHFMKTFKDSEKKVQDHRNAHLANLCTFVRNMLTTMICVVVKYLPLLVFCVKSFKHIMCLI